MRNILFFLLLIPFFTKAQLPLITDNTGTQDAGNGQIELSNGLGYHNEHRCTETYSEFSGVFTYGISSKTDIVLGIPFTNISSVSDSLLTKTAGFSDISIEVKYRFFTFDKTSFAVKPGLSAPTGNYNEGLGAGKFSGSLYILSTIGFTSFAINGNIGYLQNNNRCGSARNIWHASVSADYCASDKLHLVFNTGLEKNPDVTDKTLPAFGLLGFYYFLNENFEIGAAYKNGLTPAETKHAFTYSLTVRF